MADTSRGSWQTVDDEEARAWRRMVARQRARNEAQAAAAERRHWARQAEGAAGGAAPPIDAAVIGPATHATISRNPTAERVARAVKPLGRASPALLGVESAADYAADRRDGMPADEALVRNGAALSLGLAGGAAGGALGSLFAPGLGTLVGSAAGSMFGVRLSEEVGDGYAHVKGAAQRAMLPYTDPRYMMRALGGR